MENLEKKLLNEKYEDLEDAQSINKFSLWNPDVAVVLSLFFTPFFGALIQKKNWLALDEQEKANSSHSWMIFTIIFHMAILYFEYSLLPGYSYTVSREYSVVLNRIVDFVPWIWVAIWYFFNGRFQRGYLIEKMENVYPWRSWGKPIYIAISLFFVFLVFHYLFVFLSGQFLYWAFFR